MGLTAPGRQLSTVEKAEAALTEVGANAKPSLTAGGHLQVWSATPADRALALRASYLVVMDEEGPDALVRCSLCATNTINPICTPVRDALMGRTCGRTT